MTIERVRPVESSWAFPVTPLSPRPPESERHTAVSYGACRDIAISVSPPTASHAIAAQLFPRSASRTQSVFLAVAQRKGAPGQPSCSLRLQAVLYGVSRRSAVLPSDGRHRRAQPPKEPHQWPSRGASARHPKGVPPAGRPKCRSLPLSRPWYLPRLSPRPRPSACLRPRLCRGAYRPRRSCPSPRRCLAVSGLAPARGAHASSASPFYA